jgi:hypothetical protein
MVTSASSGSSRPRARSLDWRKEQDVNVNIVGWERITKRRRGKEAFFQVGR